MYSKLAREYNDYSSKKLCYLDAIDDLIIMRSEMPIQKLLDVGGGDGRRAKKFSEKLGIKNVALMDNCDEMLALGKNPSSWKYIHNSIEDYSDYSIKYDLIICLWNVLGHIHLESERKRALRNIKTLLAKEGKLFLDVNNRYNFRAYGLKNVFRNILLDFITNTEKSGDIEFVIEFNETKVSSSVHLHRPIEIERIIRESRLHIMNRYIVDYDSGKMRKSVFEGQLLYEIIRE